MEIVLRIYTDISGNAVSYLGGNYHWITWAYYESVSEAESIGNSLMDNPYIKKFKIEVE